MEKHYNKKKEEECSYFIMNPIHNNFNDIKKFNKIEMELNLFNEVCYKKIPSCFQKDLDEFIDKKKD
jgi:hypothetical protein